MADFQRPRGTRDFTPEEMLIRRWAEGRMREAISSFGYSEISTPTFENTDLFVARSGQQVLEQIYEFEDKGGRSLSLRPELTAPVMRFYNSNLRNLPKPLRISYFGNCFRYERPQKGRYREFWQMGLEFIGKRTCLALAEVVSVAISALESVGLNGYVVRVGHVSLLRSLLKDMEIDPEADREIMIAIDKKNKETIDTHVRSRYGKDPTRLIELISNTYDRNSYNDVLDRIGEINEEVAPETEELRQVLSILLGSGAEIRLDPSISRGLDYYDGMVFEIDAPGLGAEKQICGGGAYSLSSVFGSEVEGIGFGLGFDRILVALGKEDRDLRSGKRIYLMPMGERAEREALNISSMARSAGVTCVIETTGRGFKKVINSAVGEGCSHMLVLGDNELKDGIVSVKDLSTKEQTEIEVRDLENFFNDIIQGK